MKVVRIGLRAAEGITTLLLGISALIMALYWVSWMFFTTTPWRLSGALLWTLITAALSIPVLVFRNSRTGGE